MIPAFFKERHDWVVVTLRRDCPNDDVGSFIKGLTEERARREGLCGIHTTTIDMIKDDDGYIQYIEVGCKGYKK